MKSSDYKIFFVIYGLDYMFSIILSFIFIQYYVKKRVNKLILIICYFLLFGNFLLMFTIPYEMIWRKFSKTYKKTDVNVVGIEHVLRFNYQIVFFFLVSSTRYVVPFFKHFEQSGEFTLCRKIWDAFKGALFEILFFTLIIVVLAVILLNVVMALFIGFTLVTLIYALVFLAHSMITIPKKLNIHSDIKLSIEYYEYKANKKLGELTKNHEKIISTYYQCQETIKYIDNIEDYMKNKGIKLDDNEKPENEKDDAINNSIDNNINEDENIINEDNNDIKENKNNLEENLINEENKEKTEKEKEDEKIKTEKDYKKNKSIVKYKKYINLLIENIQELVKKYNVNLGEKKKETPLKKYKQIVEKNFEMKLADREIERITAQIVQIYNEWAQRKGLLLEITKNNKNDINEIDDEKYEFIPPANISVKKINFYRKYNKIIYKSLMIFVIILDLVIIFQEISLCLPINISLFSYIFNNVQNQIVIHIVFIIIAGIFYSFASYSFTKIKSLGVKYMIFGNNQTNSLGLIMFCHRLTSVSYPISMNILLMIFYRNIEDSEKETSIIEKNYGEVLASSVYYIISSLIPILLITIMILDYFNVCGRLCKKKQNKQSFYLKNEMRERNIINGRAYLMKLNKDYLGRIENIEQDK